MAEPSARLAAAREAVEQLGAHVFPLRPRGKTRALDTSWKSLATQDAARLAALFGPTARIQHRNSHGSEPTARGGPRHPGKGRPRRPLAGRALRRGCTASARQQRNELASLRTYTVGTPSGGRHLYFRRPAGSPWRTVKGVSAGRSILAVLAGTSWPLGRPPPQAATRHSRCPVARCLVVGRTAAAVAGSPPAPDPRPLRACQSLRPGCGGRSVRQVPAGGPRHSPCDPAHRRADAGQLGPGGHPWARRRPYGPARRRRRACRRRELHRPPRPHATVL